MRQCLKDKIIVDKVGNFTIAHRKGNPNEVGIAKRSKEDLDDEMGTILALARYFDISNRRHVSSRLIKGIIDIITKPLDYILVTNQDKREKLYMKHESEGSYDNDEDIFYIETSKYIFVEDLIFKKINRIK